jgi:microcystin-dependent protein
VSYIDAIIGEIRAFAGFFVPEGWMECDGRLLSIMQYTAAFSLLDTRYGGDGNVSFGVPDLRGRTPVGADAQHPLGTQFGSPIDESRPGGEIAFVPFRYIICIAGMYPMRP